MKLEYPAAKPPEALVPPGKVPGSEPATPANEMIWRSLSTVCSSAENSAAAFSTLTK